MAFNKKTWEDGESNPIMASDLNRWEDGIEKGQSEELIAVSSTAPTTFSDGDKYYNTTDNLVYTASDISWGNGKTPIEGVFYVVLSDNANYYYDGTTLVAVGGGKETIVIQDETPPTDEGALIWVDTGEVSNLGSEVVNTLSGNETNKAPSVKSVNDTINYSTSETVIGKFDNKPLYRKVIYYQNTSTIGEKSATTNIKIQHNISNLKLCTRQDIIHANGHLMPIAVGSSTGEINGWSGITQVDTTDINFRIINDTWNATTWTIILEYTKTTD